MPEVEVKPTDPVTPKEEQNKEEKKVTDVLYDKTEKEDEKPTEEEKPAEPKVEEKPKEEEKPAEKKVSKEPEEVKYELKLSEGSPLSAEHVEKTVAFAKKQGLSQDQAQATLDRESSVLSSFVDEQVDKQVALSTQWAEDVKNDKDIGGDAFEKNAELAKRVVNQFGTEELKKDLNSTGYGNYPGLVRMLVKVGQAMSEDQLVRGTLGTPKRKLSPAELLYPTSGDDKQ